MPTIQPQGELLRKAVKWYSEERKAHPDKSRSALVDAACIQFNLSPKDAEALRKYTQDQDDS